MKTPKGLGQPVLYLDYDGVLHNDACFWHPRRGAYLNAGPGHTLFQYAEMLEEYLAPYPDIRVVLSTSWVRQYRCAGAAKRLPHTLRDRVIGATYHSQMLGSTFWDKPRWLQSWDDVLRRRPGSWLAIDNDVADWLRSLNGIWLQLMTRWASARLAFRRTCGAALLNWANLNCLPSALTRVGCDARNVGSKGLATRSESAWTEALNEDTYDLGDWPYRVSTHQDSGRLDGAGSPVRWRPSSMDSSLCRLPSRRLQGAGEFPCRSL